MANSTSEIEQKISVLKFQLQVANPSTDQGQKIQKQINSLQRDLAFQKIREGSPS